MVALIGAAFYVIITWAVWATLAYIALSTAIHLTRGILKSTRRVDGKVFVITGANQGIGFETALELVRRGGHVVLACRSRSRAESAQKRIEDILKEEAESKPHAEPDPAASTGKTTFIELDLCSFASVRRFVENLSSIVDHVDVLINNAGIVPDGVRAATKDGLEETFQANYLGHFLLTNLMLPLLEKAPQARIINVTSLLYLLGQIDPAKFEDLVRGTGEASRDTRYMQTKLAIVMWTLELARRLKHTGITVNCVHPGLVKTNIAAQKKTLLAIFVNTFGSMFGKNALEGAQTQLHLAISGVGAKISGAYFEDCRKTPLLRGTDPVTNQQLWEATERVIKTVELDNTMTKVEEN